MNIKQLTEQLETQINQKLTVLGTISKEIMELDSKILELSKLISQKERQLEEIIVDLRPVEYIVRKSNPEICKFIDGYIKSKAVPCGLPAVESDFDVAMTISSFDKKD